jgi:hypothetical protein
MDAANLSCQRALIQYLKDLIVPFFVTLPAEYLPNLVIFMQK